MCIRDSTFADTLVHAFTVSSHRSFASVSALADRVATETGFSPFSVLCYVSVASSVGTSHMVVTDTSGSAKLVESLKHNQVKW